MQKMMIACLLLLTSCASKTVTYPVVTPEGSLSLEKAIEQGPADTTAYLKSHLPELSSYDGLYDRDPMAQVPESLRAVKAPPLPKEKSQTQQFIRKFRAWNDKRREKHAQELLPQFSCERAQETQALGFTMEIDFPAESAINLAKELHEKVVTCENVSRSESFFRLAIFSIQKGDCSKALGYLDNFPTATEKGASDRLAYVKSFCVSTSEVTQRNPWSGYGSLLKDAEKKSLPTPAWFLSTRSGSEDWDRLLVSFVELTEKGKKSTIQYIAGKLNYEQMRSLPHSFQASLLVLMSNAGADLAVFQVMHRYFADHPEMISPAVENLLFPTRYWNEIVQNSKEADPILVKALIRQESAFNPQARSRARASGLMQLIYPTAKRFGVTRPQQLLKPEENIHAGAKFLAQLIEQFGSVELALAAYNAGPAVVRQWQKRYPTDDINLFVEMIPYSETREYVRLVRRNYRVYESLLSRPQILGETRAPASH